MVKLGFHASPEQFSPSSLLKYVEWAEQAGFQAAMCSDHFHPWSVRQGQSGYAWSWLGAAMQATSFSYGVVCAPGQRYHPAIVAQAAATLVEIWIERDIEIGFDAIYFNHIGRDLDTFLRVWSERVIPHFATSALSPA